MGEDLIGRHGGVRAEQVSHLALRRIHDSDTAGGMYAAPTMM